MSKLHKSITFAVTLGLAAPGSAQVLIGQQQGGPRDSRAQVGVVIPFGSAGSSQERAPRLEVWSSHSQAGGNSIQNPRDQMREPTISPVRLGLTLQQRPQLMLNGQQMPQQTDGKNASTAGKIAIGIGITVVVVFGLALAGTFGQITPD